MFIRRKAVESTHTAWDAPSRQNGVICGMIAMARNSSENRQRSIARKDTLFSAEERRELHRSRWVAVQL